MTLFQKSQTKGKTKTSTSACSFFAARFFDDERDFTLVLSANNIGIAPLTSLRLGFFTIFREEFLIHFVRFVKTVFSEVI